MRILYLDLDTLRPDHLGCYGYGRNTSPNIDSIAKDGMIFTNYHCSDAPCLPSRTALMSGQFGIKTGVVGHGGTAADMRLEGRDRHFQQRLNRESLPGFLRQNGFKTTSISPFAERHSAWWFNAGFNEMYNTGKRGMESAEEITPVVMDWINKNGTTDNWFLQINYWDAHTPYRTPIDYDNPFKNDSLDTWIDEKTLTEHRAMVGPHGAREIMMYDNKVNKAYPKHLGEIKDMKDLKQFFDGYDSGIRYMDSHLGLLFNRLKELGVFDDTIIIISSDHGENMGEFGIYGEHATADYATTRIPMIVRIPNMKRKGINRGLHYNLDLPPTLAEYLGLAPIKGWDGQSYADTFSISDDLGRASLVVGQCAHGCQRGVRFGKWMYIRTYHDHYHLFPKEMLFDIEKDPYEQHNVAEENIDVCREASHILLNWHDEMMMKSSSDADPLWTVMKEGGGYHSRGFLKSYCNYLEETDRGKHIPELKKRHPQEFI